MEEPKIAQKGPYGVDVEKGKTILLVRLRPERSAAILLRQACRNALLQPVAFTAEETKKVFLCGCKRTKTPPFCDGTHMKL